MLEDKILRRLSKLAKAATRGPWSRWKGHTMVVAGVPRENTSVSISGYRGEVCECSNEDEDDDEALLCRAEANARYIAYAHPKRVLTLIKEVRKLQDDRTRLYATARSAAEEATLHMPILEGVHYGVGACDGVPVIHAYGVSSQSLTAVPDLFFGFTVSKHVTGQVMPA